MTTNYKEGDMFLSPYNLLHFFMYSPLIEDDFAEVGYCKILCYGITKKAVFYTLLLISGSYTYPSLIPSHHHSRPKHSFTSSILIVYRRKVRWLMYSILEESEGCHLGRYQTYSGSFVELSNWLFETRSAELFLSFKNVGYVSVYKLDVKDGLFRVRVDAFLLC